MAQGAIETADTSALVRLGNTEMTVADTAEDVRGRKVFDKAGHEIGEVEDLLIDEREKKVRFLAVSSGGFLGLGASRFLIPVDAVARVQPEGVYIDHEREHVAQAPRYDPDIEARDAQDFYGRIYGHFGLEPFWGPGYTDPRFPRHP